MELDGSPGATIVQAVSREEGSVLYWDLDGEYLGETRGYHEMSLRPAKGPHVLTVTDERGRLVNRRFTVLSDSYNFV